MSGSRGSSEGLLFARSAFVRRSVGGFAKRGLLRDEDDVRVATSAALEVAHDVRREELGAVVDERRTGHLAIRVVSTLENTERAHPCSCEMRRQIRLIGGGGEVWEGEPQRRGGVITRPEHRVGKAAGRMPLVP